MLRAWHHESLSGNDSPMIDQEQVLMMKIVGGNYCEICSQLDLLFVIIILCISIYLNLQVIMLYYSQVYLRFMM